MDFKSGEKKIFWWSICEDNSIFSNISSLGLELVRKIKKLGKTPYVRISLIECCVGLVLSSPLVEPNEINGETKIGNTFSYPYSGMNCEIASVKGIHSASPTVPPISINKKSGSSAFIML